MVFSPVVLLLLVKPRLLARFLIRTLIWVLFVVCLRRKPRRIRRRRGCRKPPAILCRDATAIEAALSGGRRKPEWVHQEVLRIAVFIRSCRNIVDAFNRRHGQYMTVSHGFVNNVCRANQEVLAHRRRVMRRRSPWFYPRNGSWAMDLTQLPGVPGGEKITTLGLIDQGTRRKLCLCAIARKCTWILLGHLCFAIAEFGKPRSIKTDNEAMFTSWLWKRALRWAGIRPQRIKPRHPWQNGRIERFFGTLKTALRGMKFSSHALAQQALDEFAGFYNHARPHRNLGALTPIEAWHGNTRQDVMRRAGCGQWVQALDGRLVAYHLRL